MIYSFAGFSFTDRLALRCMCRLFNEVEKILTLDEHRYKMLKPMPLFAIFPHPNYPTLNGLMNKLNEEYAALPNIVWEECTAPGALVVGMKVRVKYVDDEYSDDDDDDDETDEEFDDDDDATIHKVNDGETFDVVFDDVYSEPRKNVPLNEIQIQNVSHSCCFITCIGIGFFPHVLYVVLLT